MKEAPFDQSRQSFSGRFLGPSRVPSPVSCFREEPRFSARSLNRTAGLLFSEKQFFLKSSYDLLFAPRLLRVLSLLRSVCLFFLPVRFGLLGEGEGADLFSLALLPDPINTVTLLFLPRARVLVPPL